MTYVICTNRQPREVLDFCELTPAEQCDFDYRGANDGAAFTRYRGTTYDLSDFPRAPADLTGWDGALSDSFFSAIVCRFVDGGERVVMGTVLS